MPKEISPQEFKTEVLSCFRCVRVAFYEIIKILDETIANIEQLELTPPPAENTVN